MLNTDIRTAYDIAEQIGGIMDKIEQAQSPQPAQIQSVVKAIRILNLLADAQCELSLGEIAKRLGLPKSTTHGLLSTLRDFDYIEQSPFTGRYRLGLHLLKLGNAVARGLDVCSVARPYIRELVSEFSETVHLAILDQDQVLYIDKQESNQSLRIVSEIGLRLPSHCTGVGKVLLAHLRPERVRKIAATRGLPHFTKNTITSPEALEVELARVRKQGYAVDDEEIMDGLRCVAAPIRDYSGQVTAAVSISGPVVRLSGGRFDEAARLIVQVAGDISRRLGLSKVGTEDRQL